MDLIIESRKVHCFNENYKLIFQKSGKFNIEEKETKIYTDYLAVNKIFIHNKDGGLSFYYINNKLIVIDTTFKMNFTLKFLETGFFKIYKPDLYIKYEPDKNLENILGCKIASWVMFPAGWGLVERFKWNNKYTKLASLASGYHSYLLLNRRPWFDKAKERRDLFHTGIPIPQEEYLKHLMDSKFGVILSPRRDKNTREYEFTSNYIPMALNYQPKYEIPFEPMEHYYYLQNPDDLLKLDNVDAIKYSDKSKWLWKNYFRSDKAVDWLLSIIK